MSGSSGPVDWTSFVVGLVVGMVARLANIRRDHRHYPGWPSGFVNQVAMGSIASLIGAAIVPALLAKSWQAATFLALAATQFIGVRQTEMTTLQAEEQLILVPRGPAYIMGIAATLESRNFLAMLLAAAAALVTHFAGLDGGVVVSLVLLVASEYLMRGHLVGEYVRTRPGKVRFEKGTLLFVDDVMLMEVGLPHTRERLLTEGLGVILEPKNRRGESLLWNLAQRQAIAHEAASAVGVQKDVGYPDQMPLVRMKMPYPDGTAALVILPVVRDMERLRQAIEACPVLEGVRTQPWPAPHVHGQKVRRAGQEMGVGLEANGPEALPQSSRVRREA